MDEDHIHWCEVEVMTHFLCVEEESLPQGWMIQNAYIEMCNGSKNVAVIVINSMAYPQTLKKKIPVARAVAANQVPEPQMWPGTINTLDGAQGIQTEKLTAEQRQEKLFQKLDLSSLGSWPPVLADSIWLLLAEYHDIFSWNPVSLAAPTWMNMWLKSPMTPHLRNDSGRFLHYWRKKSVHTCKRCWIQVQCGPARVCGVILWYWFKKKDRNLCFCIDFCHLNAHMKKDSYLLPRIPRGTEKTGQCRPPFMPGPEVQILADQDGCAVKAVHCIYCWQPGLLWVWLHAFWAVQHANHIPEVNAEVPHGAESNILPHLPWWYSCFSQKAEEHLHHLCIVLDQFREHNLKLTPSKCDFFRNEITYLAHWISKDGVWPSNSNLEAIAECASPQSYTKVHTFLGLVGHYRRFIKGVCMHHTAP